MLKLKTSLKLFFIFLISDTEYIILDYKIVENIERHWALDMIKYMVEGILSARGGLCNESGRKIR